MSVNPTGVLTLNPTADAYVKDGSSAATNYGTATTLQVRTSATSGNNHDAYFKYDLSGASTIGSAKLRFYAALSASGSMTTFVYPVSNTSWIETGTGSLNWNNKPPLGTAIGTGLSVTSTTYQWYEADVTSFVQSEKAAGRNLISFGLQSESEPFQVNSREAGYNAAQLIVNSPSAATKTSDFDGDGRTDVSLFRASDNTWYILKSFNETVITAALGLIDDKLLPGDYDGDNRTDYAVFRPSDATWYIWQSRTNTLVAVQWGSATDIPVPGDYDGDGKIDVAVWRPSTGNWNVRQSSGGAASIVTFGQNGDVPLTGDFDGDGKTDRAVFRPSATANGSTWHVLQSTGGTIVRAFGQATDKLMPSDYDGDGRTDLGVWRASTGYWYTASSLEPTPAQNFSSTQFGVNGDVPVPGDYDGDGKTDKAVFSSGVWNIQNSSNNTTKTIQFGLSTDKPTPRMYFPD